MRKQLGKKLVFAPLPAYRTLGPVIAPAFKAGKAIK